jgi:ComEC/Rec2-related protein
VVVAVVWVLTLAVAAGVARRYDLFLILCGACALVTAWRCGWKHALFLACLSCACAWLGHHAAARYEADRAAVGRTASAAGDARVALDGVVAGFPQTGPYGTRFDFATMVAGRRVLIEVRAACFDVSYGDRYRLRARWVRPSKDAARFLASRGVAGSARAGSRDMTRVGVAGNPVLRAVFWPAHRFLRTRLSRAMGGDSGLAIGMLLGERSQLDDAVRDAVRRLGITHLLAISGMHLTTVAGCVLLATRARPTHQSRALLVALTVYTATVGDVESLTRAYLMAVLVLAMRATIRPLRPVDALGTAWFLMSVADPLSLRSVGLQLSFAATFAVLVCLPRVAGSRAGDPRSAAGWIRGALVSLRSAFVLSVAVEVFIAPLQLHHFHCLSVAGPLATVVFFLPVTLVLLGSVPVAVLSAAMPALEWPGWVLGGLSTATTEAIVACGHAVPPPVAIPEPRPWLYYGALFLAWRMRRHRAAWVAAAALLALSFA